MPYPDVYPPEAEGFRPLAAARSMFLDGLDRGQVATIVDRLQAASAPMAVTQLRVLAGRWPACPPRPPPSRTAGAA